MSRIAADASVFHAIADPTRRAVLDALREGDLSVSALMERIEATVAGGAQRLARLTQSAFSQHL